MNRKSQFVLALLGSSILVNQAAAQSFDNGTNIPEGFKDGQLLPEGTIGCGKYTEQIRSMDEELKKLRTENEKHKQEINSLQNTIQIEKDVNDGRFGTTLKGLESQLIKKHERELVIKENQLQTECMISKRQITKQLHSKYTQSIEKITQDLWKKCKEDQDKKQSKLEKKVTELETINGGIRMDIKKDTIGKYQITHVNQIDNTYNLDGKVFEFTKCKGGDCKLYQVNERVCPAIVSVKPKEPEIVQPKEKEEDKDDYYEGKETGENLYKPELSFNHEKKDYNKACAGLFDKCGNCGSHELLDHKSKYTCELDDFCFTHDHKPHCGNCTDVWGPCKYCSYTGCTACESGQWLLNGYCWESFW